MPHQPPVEAFEHDDRRVNIPTADANDLVDDGVHAPKILSVQRDTALDPQLVWRGKDAQDEALEVAAPPLWIQEKIDPRALVENLRRTAQLPEDEPEATLFDDFDGLDGFESIDYYRHQANWSNRMILGDSLEVMASLAEREDLRAQVQCIYIDPPYGIKFNSNWQVSTSKRDVKDKISDATREVEQIKAFRDTWELGIHSYLSYLRDRLQVAHSLLTESGSVFVQIGDENVHLVRGLLDEVFGRDNFVSMITYSKTSGATAEFLPGVSDYVLWFAKDIARLKFRQLYMSRAVIPGRTKYDQAQLEDGTRTPVSRVPQGERHRLFRWDNLTSQSAGREKGEGAASWFPVQVDGQTIRPTLQTRWKTNEEGMNRLLLAGRIGVTGKTLGYLRFHDDFPYMALSNSWADIGGIQSRADPKVYVVQTSASTIQRCILMTTEPGDLVLDPTCGSGTTAYVAEQWGRRWITIDTSRVALALARQRLMAAKFPYYLLADSPQGQAKERSLTGVASVAPAAAHSNRHDIRRGFVYERTPHVTLKSIATNAEIHEGMSRAAVDAAIARHAEVEMLVDRPYEDRSKVRVAGRFTVESLSPHRSLSFETDVSGETAHNRERDVGETPATAPTYERTILDNLVSAGVQNGRKSERLVFDDVEPYPGAVIQAVGVRADAEDGTPQRIAVAIGPEYGTVDARFVKAAAKEALRGAGFDILLVLGFSFAANALQTAGEFQPAQAAEPGEFAVVADEKQFGKLPVLLVRMNTDLAMGSDLLKKTGAGNLFTIFGEPDIEVEATADGVVVEIKGIDVYDPTTGQVRVDEPDTIALWMVDTDYDGESFFVRHAYFSGGNDPFARLKKALKAEIDEAAWTTLYGTRSRPFPFPTTGKIAVKAINDYGDEVLTVIDLAAAPTRRVGEMP